MMSFFEVKLPKLSARSFIYTSHYLLWPTCPNEDTHMLIPSKFKDSKLNTSS